MSSNTMDAADLWDEPADPRLAAVLAQDAGPALLQTLLEVADRGDELSARDLLGAADAATRVRNVVDGLLHRIVGSLFRLPAAHTDQLVWAHLELAGLLHLSGQQAVALTHTAEDLAKGLLPATEAALTQGRISGAHAQVIAAALTNVPDPDRRAPLDAALAGEAEQVSSGRLRYLARATVAAAEPSGVEDDERRRYDARGLFLRRPAGEDPYLAAQLPDDALGAVLTGVDRLAGRTGPDDGRSLAQRRADALVELATVGLERQGANAPSKTGVGVIVPLWALTGMPPDSEPAGAGTGGGTGAGAPGRPPSALGGQLSDGSPISAALAAELCCGAPLTWLTSREDGQLLDLGRTTRIPSRSLDRYVRIRDGFCQFPHCTVPTTRTTAHHAVFWSAGGTTDKVNLVSLCNRHHHGVHRGGWRLLRHGDETTTWTSPRGATYHVRPRTLPGGEPGRRGERTLFVPTADAPVDPWTPPTRCARRPSLPAQGQPARGRPSGAARRHHRPGAGRDPDAPTALGPEDDEPPF